MTPARVGAAKGIPVWVGARLIGVPEHNIAPCTVVAVNCTDAAEHAVSDYYAGRSLPGVLRLSPWNEVRPMDRDDAIDLADPDTRAAYLRRLAVALGCPESTADEGVRFYLDDGAGWQMDAGFAEGDVLTHAWYADLRDLGISALNDTDDRLEALALAWPADKRVTT